MNTEPLETFAFIKSPYKATTRSLIQITRTDRVTPGQHDKGYAETHFRRASRNRQGKRSRKTSGKDFEMIKDEKTEISNVADSATNALKRHSASAALVGLGLGWFMWESMSNKSSEPETSRQETQTSKPESHFTEQQSSQPESHHSFRERIEPIKHKAAEIKETAVQKARPVREKASRVIDERPLLIGAVGLAAGVLIGVLTSNYFKDSEFMGQTRQNLKQRTRSLLHNTKEKTGHVLDVAKRAAREEAEKQDLITH